MQVLTHGFLTHKALTFKVLTHKSFDAQDFNMLNFENGRGVISLSSYWQAVIRGGFLLLVVLLQNRLARRLKR